MAECDRGTTTANGSNSTKKLHRLLQSPKAAILPLWPKSPAPGVVLSPAAVVVTPPPRLVLHPRTASSSTLHPGTTTMDRTSAAATPVKRNLQLDNIMTCGAVAVALKDDSTSRIWLGQGSGFGISSIPKTMAHGDNPKPNLTIGRNTQQTYNNTSLYIIITLERQYRSAPWGLSLRYQDGTFYLGDEIRPFSVVRGYWITKNSNTRPDQSTMITTLNLPHLIQSLFREPSPVATAVSSTRHAVQEILQPGDTILAVGGIAMTEFKSLEEFSQYVKSTPSTMLQWVFLRRDGQKQQQQQQHNHLPTTKRSGLNMLQHGMKVLPLPLRAASGTTTTQTTSNSIKPTVPRKLLAWTPPPAPKNPLFRNEETGEMIQYQDWSLAEDLFDPDREGTHAALFVRPIHDFQAWLTQRKRTWRTSLYRPYSDEEFYQELSHWEEEEDFTRACDDFWSSQGFDSLSSWIANRTCQWRARYSWNKTKRQRLALDCERSVNINDGGTQNNFDEWLRVRKNQWRVQRRKRKRHLHHHVQETQDMAVVVVDDDDHDTKTCCAKTPPPPPPQQQPAQIPLKEIQMIDELIEEEEKRKKALLLREKSQRPFDISFIFDSAQGCPDDVVCKILKNLQPVERFRLLVLNRETRHQLTGRENLWRLMCPTRWKLPRRPRKPWYMIYQKNLQLEMEASRKQCDDLLSKASQCLFSGDLLGTMEKLVSDAERKINFNVNYVSGVVCERNSLLNLAVIHQRHRVVRWLVETKAADIETSDRGNFTPLLNAAWAGDRYLVRYLMQRGADRTAIGRFHYTKPVAPPDFGGRTAEGWAKEKGHDACARLLALGL